MLTRSMPLVVMQHAYQTSIFVFLLQCRAAPEKPTDITHCKDPLDLSRCLCALCSRLCRVCGQRQIGLARLYVGKELLKLVLLECAMVRLRQTLFELMFR